MPKDLATSCWAAERLAEGQIAYACCDVAITWKAWKVLYPAMQQEGRMNAYRLQRNAIPAVVRMEQAGMPFDPEEHAIQSEKWAREYAEAAHEFKEETGRPPPISQPQIREYLQQILTPAEQDAWPKTAKAGMLKSGEDDLRKLVGRFPSIRSLLVVQAKHTLQKTFGAGLLARSIHESPPFEMS
jgi:DNA polymerase I-like protein with 3'-5' exonuclease and polymerase domains